MFNEIQILSNFLNAKYKDLIPKRSFSCIGKDVKSFERLGLGATVGQEKGLSLNFLVKAWQEHKFAGSQGFSNEIQS